MARDLTIHYDRNLGVRDCAIRRALYAEADNRRLVGEMAERIQALLAERDAATAEAAVYRQALDSIAAWNDAAGDRTLAEEGRYTSFDYPEAVRKAREALAKVKEVKSDE